IKSLKEFTLQSGRHLYSKDLSVEAVNTMESCYTDGGKITISYEDEIVEHQKLDGELTFLKTKKLDIQNPYLIFGVGIKPNIDDFRKVLTHL
ncbi:MAG: hyaluronate lyase, partial [Campylobacterota bacterium]|nr:hyaluronate lyase [Campylobacterota bacterium]